MIPSGRMSLHRLPARRRRGARPGGDHGLVLAGGLRLRWIEPHRDFAALCGLRLAIGWEAWTPAERPLVEAYDVRLGLLWHGTLVGWVGAVELRRRCPLLVDLMVHPDFRRRGVASALIARCATLLERKRLPRMETRCDPARRRFYVAQGFRDCPSRRLDDTLWLAMRLPRRHGTG